MTRINTNVSSLVAQNRLAASNDSLNTSLTRLSTGLRINSGSDDPAGLIASEALRSEVTGITKAISNTQRASQIIGTADSALGQVSNLLNDVRGLVVEAANSGALSEEEVAANQLQIDSSLEAINRIAQTTTFQGRKLLDGSLDYVTSAGTGFASAADLKIDQANLGASGKIDVSVDVKSAATRASTGSTGFSATGTAASSTGTITFDSASAADEASGVVTLGAANTIGAEATGTITLANSFSPDAEATGNVSLSGGLELTITATDGGAADGLKGDDTIVEINYAAGGGTSNAYDADTDTLTLTIDTTQSQADQLTGLAANGADFVIADNTSTGAADGAPGTEFRTGALTGGSNAVAAATFDLTAVDGGRADGATGNDTQIVLTSGAATAATFDADANTITVSVADGASIDDIASAINTGLGDDFIASNVTNGTNTYSTADNATLATPISGGTDPTAAGVFSLEAVNGGAADGTAGNGATLNFVSGAANSASYDADTNVLNITVADGATIDDITAAIDADGTFVTRNTQNGNSLFNDGDLGVNTPTTALAGGTDDTVSDVITVTSDTQSPDSDGVTVSLVADNSLAAGTARAVVGDDGNITVSVSSLGPVNTGVIASSINDLDGFSATQTASDGDGSYDITTDTAAVATPLSGGSLGGGLNDDLVLQISGSAGAETFQFDRGASLESVIASINLVSDSIGITASDDGGTLKLESTGYGSDALIDVEVISEGENGTFEAGLTRERSTGTDIVATVNGTQATGKGNTLSINTSTLDLSLTVDEGSSTDVNFTITGGGATFQLGGQVTSNQQASLGIGSVSTGQLGGVNGRLYELGSGGDKSLTNDISGAAKIIDEVISSVNQTRGRLGSFQATTLESNLVSLNETRTNLKEAESSIRDADFAQESANLTRAQVLQQSGTNVLSIANQNPRNVLSLLR